MTLPKLPRGFSSAFTRTFPASFSLSQQETNDSGILGHFIFYFSLCMLSLPRLCLQYYPLPSILDSTRSACSRASKCQTLISRLSYVARNLVRLAAWEEYWASVFRSLASSSKVRNTMHHGIDWRGVLHEG